jgi:hypothetical protein
MLEEDEDHLSMQAVRRVFIYTHSEQIYTKGDGFLMNPEKACIACWLELMAMESSLQWEIVG